MEKHIAAVQRFIREQNREPTALDFDDTEYLPTARTIQRNYGGLKQFRRLANLNTVDFTKGKDRSLKAKKSMEDCLKDESDIFIALLKKYGEGKVSSPARLHIYSGKTADFRIMKNGINYLIDVFKPNSVQSFRGCINIKNKKYLSNQESFYLDPVKIMYVCVNEDVMVPTSNMIPVLSLSEFRAMFLD